MQLGTELEELSIGEDQSMKIMVNPNLSDFYYWHFHPEFELFDVVKDPYEALNLAVDENYAELLEEMKDKMKAYQLRTSDPWIIMWDHDSSMQGTGVGL